ncbi:MAG: dinitrogenase iron-molybdenum cofactor biosynthesis protein [Geobacter sp.]|nr:dinitrogenase iron-molybdenum cofactor biosynthesis protein [Geobacter sp.]
MLIAVATKDGKEINQHFGHAERFLIYDVSDAAVKLVDEKKVERYCTYDEAHPLRGHVLRGMATALEGCSAIACSQVGPAPQEEMARLGFPVYALQGEIKPALVDLSKVL